MPWSSAAHPRAPQGSASGGQFATLVGPKPATKAKPKQKAAAKQKAMARPAAKPRAAKKAVGAAAARRSVTVKRGDTLWAIARRSGESLAQLRRDNPGLFTKAHRGGNLIFPGNKVRVAAKKAAVKRPKAKAAPKRRVVKRRVAKRAVKRK